MPKAEKVTNPAGLSTDYEVVQMAVLNQTRPERNSNKFYVIELHRGACGHRVYTQYGRVGEEGTHEVRVYTSEAAAMADYRKIHRAKVGRKKDPYTELDVASSKLGSVKARGASAGHVDDATKARIKAPEAPKAPKAPKASALSQGVRDLVADLFGTSTTALTKTVNCNITAAGIETDLGVLTLGQVEKGQAALGIVHEAVKRGAHFDELLHLSGAFYTLVPHKFGRSRAKLHAATLRSMGDIAAKDELLQLMRDMLEVDGSGGVLASDDTDAKYASMGCRIEALSPEAGAFKAVSGAIKKSLIKSRMNIRRVFAVQRPDEWKAFDATGAPIGNVNMVYHGSRFPNWTGIMTRGIMMPKLVVAMGGKRTDGGWLGAGMYFGSEACTVSYYCRLGQRGSRGTYLMAVCRAALGKQKQYRVRSFGLSRPPAGYDSTWGVRGTQFADNEIVLYNTNAAGQQCQQQRLEYLVEFTTY